MDTKSLLKSKMRYYAILFGVGAFFFGYGNVNAAILQINSSSATLPLGDTTTLYVVLNSEGVAVNNAEATITFPTELIEVISISKNGSIFSLWVEEPSFSNSSGIVTFNGGVPTPGFNGVQGSIVSFVVRAKKIGQADLVFSNAAVRANDGLGTDVLKNKRGNVITIVTRKEEPADDIVPALPSPALQISSLTHPNQDQWYKDVNPTFQWVVPSGSDAVRTSIGNNESSIPHVTYSPAISEKTVKDLDDGVWYFKARNRMNGVWGPISTYIVRIDATAPQKKDVVFAYDDNSKILNITASIQDIASGIDHYEIFINDALVKTVSAKEFVGGKYGFGLNASGDNAVKLLAIDRAGNSVEASGTFRATSISVPELDPVPPTVSADEQLLVSGRTQNPDADVAINIKHDDDEPIILRTRSNFDGSFFILTPKLKSGSYDIWAETGYGGKMVSSIHIYTEATSRLLITVGSFTISAFFLAIPILVVLLFVIIFMYYVSHHYSRFQHKLKMRTALVKGDNSKILLLLKRRLERHLEILQRTRYNRILTKEEKEIKEAIESDLDEVDRAIREQK